MKKLGFGFMRLPLKDEENPASIDLEKAKELVDVFLERGFTYFDTAYPYHGGESERAIRKVLVERYPRERFMLADKLLVSALHSEEEQERVFDEQMEKCGVTYFDCYMLHNMCAETYENAEKLGSFAFIQKKKEEGKIRRIGFSFHDTPELLEKILTEHPETEFVQLQINYLDWNNPKIQSRRCLETARKHGKTVLVMEPVKGGTLAKVPESVEAMFKEYHPELSVSSWAIRFAASQEGVSMVLSGMSNLEQLRDNTDYMQDFESFEPEEVTLVERAVQMINEAVAIPCTACQYCVAECPKHIAIPEYFALYNNVKRRTMSDQFEAQFEAQCAAYENYAKSRGKASDCIGCKQCEACCPQHIEIVDRMKEVSELFDK